MINTEKRKFCKMTFDSDSSETDELSNWNKFSNIGLDLLANTGDTNNVSEKQCAGSYEENAIMLDSESDHSERDILSSRVNSRVNDDFNILQLPQNRSITISDGKNLQQNAECLKPIKRKRTAEDIAESKRLADLKKAEKMRMRMEREKVKAEKIAQKEKEKEMKSLMREAKAQYSLKDCLKYIVVMVDPHIMNDCGLGAAIYKSCEDVGVQCLTEPQIVPYTITWRRKVTEINSLCSIQTIRKDVVEDEVIGILPVGDFVQMVHTFKQRQKLGVTAGETTPTNYIKMVRAHYEGRQFTGVVQGMEQYFREQKTKKQRQHREAVAALNEEARLEGKHKKCKVQTEVSRVEMEEALTDAQLHTGCNIKFMESGQDVADLIRTFTKAIAEKPSKKDRLTSIFSFHEEGAAGVKVEKSGSGLLKAWKHQLMQFKNISPNIADALVAAYSSPRSLLNAYKKCTSEREAMNLLSDIVVRRGAGVLETSRRVGKESSRRIFCFMTCSEANTVIR